jgi:hypothetical protein
MGVDTKFYFQDRVHPNDLENAIRCEFGVEPDMSQIDLRPAHGPNDVSRYWGYITFEYNGKKYHLYFYQHNFISGGKRDGTDPDTLSARATDENRQIMVKLAYYFGGVYSQSDSTEDNEIYIPCIKEVESTNHKSLMDLIRVELGFEAGQRVFEFIQKNEQHIINYKFGHDSVKQNSL